MKRIGEHLFQKEIYWRKSGVESPVENHISHMERIINIIAFVVLCAAVYFGIQYSSRANDARNEAERTLKQIKQLERDIEEISQEQDNQDLEDLEEEKKGLEGTILSLKEDLGVDGGEEEGEKAGAEEQTEEDEEGESEE